MASFTYIRWNGSLLVADRGGVAALETTATNQEELTEHLGRDIAKDLTEQLDEHRREHDPKLDDEIAPAVLDLEEM